MEIPVDKDKKFLCVEFPGVVNNVNSAMKSLGGQETVSQVKKRVLLFCSVLFCLYLGALY